MARETLNIGSTKGQVYVQTTDDDGKLIDFPKVQYDEQIAHVIANIMMAMNQRGVRQKTVRGHQHVVNYSLKAAVNKWREKASTVAKDEMKQLLDRKVFHPI